MIKTCCVNILEIELTKWLGFMWFSLYNLWQSILVNTWCVHGNSNQWWRNIIQGILCGRCLWQSILSHTIGPSLSWMGFQGFHDEHKFQSVMAYLGSANVWCGIHDLFLNHHGKLTVTRLFLNVHDESRPSCTSRILVVTIIYSSKLYLYVRYIKWINEKNSIHANLISSMPTFLYEMQSKFFPILLPKCQL